jgi:hypothetical protein
MIAGANVLALLCVLLPALLEVPSAFFTRVRELSALAFVMTNTML